MIRSDKWYRCPRCLDRYSLTIDCVAIIRGAKLYTHAEVDWLAGEIDNQDETVTCECGWQGTPEQAEVDYPEEGLE